MTRYTTEELETKLKDFLANRVSASTGSEFPDLFPWIRIESADGETSSAVFSYDIKPWAANVLGICHGGVTATLADCCMGVLAAVFAGAATPTISLTVNYVLPVMLNQTYCVRVRLVRIGGTTAHVSADFWRKDSPENLVLTATGVYSTAAAMAAKKS